MAAGANRAEPWSAWFASLHNVRNLHCREKAKDQNLGRLSIVKHTPGWEQTEFVKNGKNRGATLYGKSLPGLQVVLA